MHPFQQCCGFASIRIRERKLLHLKSKSSLIFVTEKNFKPFISGFVARGFDLYFFPDSTVCITVNFSGMHHTDKSISVVVLWVLIRICIGSVFRSFLNMDPYLEYWSGSTHANIGSNGGKRFKILINNSETQLIINFFGWQFVLNSFKTNTCFIEN